MIRKLLAITVLFFLVSCNQGNVANVQDTLAPINPLNPGNPNATPTVDPGSDPNAESHVYGKPRGTAHASSGKPIPISFVFLNSSTEVLTNNPESEAAKAIDIMNQRFTRLGVSYVKFVLKEAKAVVDDIYYNTSCNLLGSVASKYGTGTSMVMVVVHDLGGSCAGVSYLWRFPKDKNAVTMSEYTDPFVNGKWTPVVHEFAHSFGLQHTGDEYPGSVPKTGLYTFNNLLTGVSNGRSCKTEFKYFIDPAKRHNGAVSDGVTYDSYYNTMYPSYGAQPDNGFFTSGYDYSNSWAFDCWYEFAKNDI